MVMIFGGIAFVFSFQKGSTVSNLAHLGGMIFGFVYMKTQFGTRSVRGTRGFNFDFQKRWKEYKLQRARRKFQVYMRKHGPGDGPWVH
jgi:membrane associated rhomboid family serine protease